MITRAILEVQRDQYQKGRELALTALEKAKAEFNIFNGAIEACNGLLVILTAMEEFEASKPKESKENNNTEVKQ